MFSRNTPKLLTFDVISDKPIVDEGLYLNDRQCDEWMVIKEEKKENAR
jgi:hypothetical protein